MPHSPDAVALIDGEVRLSKTVSATQIANEETSKAPHLILKATVPHPVMLVSLQGSTDILIHAAQHIAQCSCQSTTFVH